MFAKFLRKTTLLKEIASNTSWLLLAETISKGASFVLALAIARHLGRDGYGAFAFALSFASLFMIFADFGFGTLTIRDVARDKSKAKHYLANITSIKLIFGIVALAAAITTLFLTNKTIAIYYVLLFGIFTLVDSFNQYFQLFFRAHLQMKFEAQAKILYTSVLVIGVAAALIFSTSIQNIIAAYIIAALITLGYLLYTIRRKFVSFTPSIRPSNWRSFIIDSWPLAAAALLMTIYFRIDITMLAFMTSNATVGQYSAAYNFVLVMNIIPALILPSIFSIISANDGVNNKKVTDTYQFSLVALTIISISLGAIMFTFANQILLLVYGTEFSQGVTTLRILIVGGAILIIDRVCIDLLNATGQFKRTLLIIGVSAVINIALNMYLIPLYADIGAALATAITEAVLLATLLVITRNYWLTIKPAYRA